MYDRTINGQPLIFGNTSALYESDMVMFDHATGSYWMQVSGESIVGTLTGERMTLLPSQTTTWALWKSQHPATQVLSRDTGFGRDYSYDPFLSLGEQFNAGGGFWFPVSENGRDARLDPGDVVLSVEIEGVQRAYPIQLLGDGVVNDQIGDVPVVVFSAAAGPTGAAYSPLVAAQLLTFVFIDGVFQDEQTASTWSLSGMAVAGELAGTQLEGLPTRSTFWFSMVASFPGIELYSGN